jgi:hypothetical protein
MFLLRVRGRAGLNNVDGNDLLDLTGNRHWSLSGESIGSAERAI